MKKISIIVPVFNCERFIERCIQALLNQTYKNHEIIIVDDGSSDNTYQLCKKYTSYQEIRLFHIRNHGVSYARNYGLKHADGEFIFFVDADDYVKNNYCETLVFKIEEENADLALCGHTIETERETAAFVPRTGIFSLEEFMNIFITTEFVNMPWAKVYKREAINVLFNENRDMGEDFEFNINYLASCNKIVCIADSLYIYNLANDASLTKDISKMGNTIYNDINAFICNFPNNSDLHRLFVLRRIKNYLSMIYINSNDLKEFILFANEVSNDFELKKLLKSLNVNDVRIWLLFNKHFILLRLIQWIINKFH